MNYWLIKSEPVTYSIDALKNDRSTGWEGVRNYQARNFMRDGMKKGDLVFFYHSNCEVPGIVGIAEVKKESHPDPTQWDSTSKYYDSKATKENPRWFMVSLNFVEKFKEIISLQELKEIKELEKLSLLQKGSRLSVLPVSEKEFNVILKLKKR